MKKYLIIFVLLFPAATAFANPIVVFDPVYWIKSLSILGTILGLETFLVVTILFFCHMTVIPSLIAVFSGNLLIYFIIFQPLLSAIENVWICEIVIVVIEGILIKVISLFDVFQLEEFKGLKWVTAFICSAIGNAFSYFLGTLFV
jgi:hypothetical protein